ncbi:MAG: ATP-binding protein [Polyangiaceae bacterium]|nr:ATP-binding protein [Polyangiaceae bacterium]MBK8939887.1 ATP-binding protein [Polyangiaceae bacterium]
MSPPPPPPAPQPRVSLPVGSVECGCGAARHAAKLVVVTGGPGAGKTAVLELVRRTLCDHAAVLPEAASILFGGGFPRSSSRPGRRAAQRAIYYVQSQVEQMVREEGLVGVGLCDRGTLDGLAYWPGDPADFFSSLETTRERELSRYAAVLHLRVAPDGAYDRTNPLRVEDASEAAVIDAKIEEAWQGHPRRMFVDSTPSFLEKATRAVELLRAELPVCCKAQTDGEAARVMAE